MLTADCEAKDGRQSDQADDEPDAREAGRSVVRRKCRLRTAAQHVGIAEPGSRQTDGRPGAAFAEIQRGTAAAERQARAGLAQVDADAGRQAEGAAEAEAPRVSLQTARRPVIPLAAVKKCAGTSARAVHCNPSRRGGSDERRRRIG